jgi:endonuclease/exonuclease/phosphatase family metal-dependent hydrolase
MRLRVLTYNTRSATNVFGQARLVEQATVVRDSAADLVLLQELDSRHQAEQFAQFAGLPHLAFGAARKSRSGEFGNAVLSRWPIEGVENHPVAPRWSLSQARAVLVATIQPDGERVHVIAAHFGLLPGEPEHAARIVLDATRNRAGPMIVGGDFNRPRASAACHRHLRSALTDAARANGRSPEPTFPAGLPVLRLDYVYVREMRVHSLEVIASSASDHRPVVAELSVAH